MSSKVVIDDISELNKETERYLSCLYQSNELGNARISTTELSNILKSHPSTVSNRLKILSELKISNYKVIDYEKNYGAKLTYYGSIIGSKIVKKKRIKELFLKRIGMNLRDIDEHIEDMHITERISNLIKQTIIDPLTTMTESEKASIRCPHGGQLPDEGGKTKPEIFYPLSYFPEGSILTIHRLSNSVGMLSREEYYNKIELHKLFPGTRITWLDTSSREVVLSKDGPEHQFRIKTKVSENLYFTDRNYNYFVP